MKWVPNALTLSRFPSAVAILWLYLGSSYRFVILPIAVFAFATDFLDGFIARTWHFESTLGAKVEPYADKSVCWATTIVVIAEVKSMWLIGVPIVCLLAYDVGIAILRWVFRKKDVMTSVFAKRKTAMLMIGLSIIYADLLMHPRTIDLFQFTGLALIWISGYFALRASVDYTRAYLGPRWVPSIPYVL